MGRLPGGILDETRDYIIKEVDSMNKSKLLKLSKTSQSSDIQGTGSMQRNDANQDSKAASSSVGGMRTRSMSPKMKELFTSNTVRKMRFPLRRVIQCAPKNVLTNPAKIGSLTCTPSITIGRHSRGVLGEFSYMIEGPASPRPLPEPFDPPFVQSSPTKKMHGSGTYDGMFGKPTYMEQGPPVRFKTFEQTGKRMLAQSMYPVQIFPTSMQTSM